MMGKFSFNFLANVLVRGILILLVISGCKESDQGSDRSVIRDDLGREISVPAGLDRGVIGLSPAVTEILASVVPSEMILARTQACDYPSWILEKPEVNSYPLDIESIVALSPDMLFSEVGIIPEDNLAKLREFGIETYVFSFENVSDVSRAMVSVGEIFSEIQKDCQASADDFDEKINREKYEHDSVLSVFGMIWTDPVYAFGYNTILSSELEIIGAKNAIDSVFAVPYPEISREYILKLDPDYFLGISYNEFHEKMVMPYPELSSLKAYRNSNFVEVDNDLLTRPSPRIPQLLSDLKEALYE